MTLLIEYVSKVQFEEIKQNYPTAKYWVNHEFPMTERLDFILIPKKLAVSIRFEPKDGIIVSPKVAQEKTT